MIIFKLSFPTNSAWNGRFSGEDNLYAKTKDIRNKEEIARLIAGSPYSYRWDDGWSASIEVYEIDGNEAAKIRRKSKGFMGYEWMIKAIMSYGKIMTETEIEEKIEDIKKSTDLCNTFGCYEDCEKCVSRFLLA